MLAAAVLSLGIARLSARSMEYVFALTAGVCTVGVAYCTTVPMLVLLHGAMGLAVWLCRIMIDTRILERCTRDTVGRTKVYVEMVFSVSAMSLCLSPTLVSLPSASSYFLFWGLVMVLASTWLWYSNSMIEARLASDRGG